MLETAIGELKRSPPVTVAPTATVARAAELMRKKKVGAVLVKKGRASWSASSPSATWWSRAMATRSWASAPVKKFMTPKPGDAASWPTRWPTPSTR